MTCIINQIEVAESLAKDAADANLSNEDIKVGAVFAKERIADPLKKIELKVVPHEFKDERVKIARVITSTENGEGRKYDVPENWQKSKWKPWFSIANRVNRLSDQGDNILGWSGEVVGKIPIKFSGMFHEAVNTMQTELDLFLDGYKKKVVSEADFKSVLNRMWGDSKRRMFSPGKAMSSENGKGLAHQLKDYNDHLDNQLDEEGPKANLETFESDAMRYLTPPEKPGLEKPIEPREVQEWDASLDQEEYQREWDRYEEDLANYEKEHDTWVKGEVKWEEESPESLGIWTKFNNAQKDIEGIMNHYQGSQKDLGGGFSVKALRQQVSEAQEMLKNMNVSSWDELPDEWFDKIGQLHSEQVSIESAKQGTRDLIEYLTSTADTLENELSRLAGHFMRNIEHAEGLEKYAEELEMQIEKIKAEQKVEYTMVRHRRIWEITKELRKTEDKIHNMLEGTATVPFENKQKKTADELINELYENETKQSLVWKGLRDEFRKMQSDNRNGRGSKNPPSDNLKKAREIFTRRFRGLDKDFSAEFAKWLDNKYKEALKLGTTPEKRAQIRHNLKVQALDNLGLGVSPKRWDKGTWILERKQFRESGVGSEDFYKIYTESGSDVAMDYETWLTQKIESGIDIENPDWVNFGNEYNRLRALTPELQVTKTRDSVEPEWTISNLSNREGIQGVGKLNDLTVKNVMEISDTAKHVAQTAMEQESRNVENERVIEFLDANREMVETKGKKGAPYFYEDLTGDGAKYVKQKLRADNWEKYVDDWATNQKRNKDGSKKTPSKEELEVLKREYNPPEVTNEDVMKYVEQQIIDQESAYNQKELFEYGDNGMNSILPNVNLVKKHSVMTDTGVKLIDSLNNMHNILAEKNKTIVEDTLPQRVRDWEMIVKSLEEVIIPDSISKMYNHPIKTSELKQNVSPQMIVNMAKKIENEYVKPAQEVKPENVSENVGTFEYSENNWQNRIRESNYRRDNAIEKQRLLQKDYDAMRKALQRENKKQVTSNKPPCKGG